MCHYCLWCQCLSSDRPISTLQRSLSFSAGKYREVKEGTPTGVCAPLTYSYLWYYSMPTFSILLLYIFFFFLFPFLTVVLSCACVPSCNSVKTLAGCIGIHVRTYLSDLAGDLKDLKEEAGEEKWRGTV